MRPDDDDKGTRAVATAAARRPGLQLLVLFGSRARGDHAGGADWDIGYLGDEGFDADALLADLVAGLGTERVDLVDLRRASGLLRYRAARDGRAVFSATGDAFERFWFEAVTFWCDAGPVLQSGYAEVLAELGP